MGKGTVRVCVRLSGKGKENFMKEIKRFSENEG